MHDHSQAGVKSVGALDYLGLPSYRVHFKCGCFGAWLSSGASVTGGDSMTDFDAEWLASRAASEALGE